MEFELRFEKSKQVQQDFNPIEELKLPDSKSHTQNGFDKHQNLLTECVPSMKEN